MNNRAIYLIVFSIFLLIVGPALFSDGMFMDGLLYATISKNLAHGVGSFWNLHLTKTLLTPFHEHPPLAFGLQSILFRLFGDSLFVERWYSLLTFLITGVVIGFIWIRLVEEKYKPYAWLPLFLWIITPLVGWAAANNMLENTMMLFTSLSVLFFIYGLDYKKFYWFVLNGIMLFLGVLTKGLVALFPLALPFWLVLIKPDYNLRKATMHLGLQMLALIASFGLLFVIQPQSFESLSLYFNKQIVGSIANVSTVDSRFFIIYRWFTEMIPVYIVWILVRFISFKYKLVPINYRWALILLLTGFSGVFPIMVSMKQSGFYMLATFPLFAIGFAFLIGPRVYLLMDNFIFRRQLFLQIFSGVLLVLALIVCGVASQKIGRQEDKIKDVYTLVQTIPQGTTIKVTKAQWGDWALHGYMYRYGEISLATNIKEGNNYFLLRKGEAIQLVKDYQKVPVDLNLYELYQKTERLP